MSAPRPLDPNECADLVRSDRWQSKARPSESDCVLWSGSRNSKGYGQVWTGSRAALAHRVAWVSAHGMDVPAELRLDHLCRVRHCVNPDHLEPVTNRENILRGIGLSAIRARATHCPVGHELTPENTDTYAARHGRRQCAECARIRSHARSMAIAEARAVLGITDREYRARFGSSMSVALAVVGSRD